MTRDVAIVWHVHQPFFVPDAEVEAQHLEPVDAGHLEVEQHQIVPVRRESLQRLLAAGRPRW